MLRTLDFIFGKVYGARNDILAYRFRRQLARDFETSMILDFWSWDHA